MLLFSFSFTSTLCEPMECSTPGFLVLHYLLEFAHTHVHRVSDAIQPSHPLLSPSLPTLNLSQHQGCSNESALCIRWAKCWSFSFSISPSNDYLGLSPLGLTGLVPLQSQGLSRVFSSITVWKHQFLGAHPSCPTLISIHDYWKSHRLSAFYAQSHWSLIVSFLNRYYFLFFFFTDRNWRLERLRSLFRVPWVEVAELGCGAPALSRCPCSQCSSYRVMCWHHVRLILT